MTDKELVELAAKAAGVKWDVSRDAFGGWMLFSLYEDEDGEMVEGNTWRPLQDDGDALRLAVHTGVFFRPEFAHFLTLERFAGQAHDDIRAHRRAIVRAAAALAVSDLAKMEGAK